MIAAATDLAGKLTGAHRTWLDPSGFDPIRLGKAPIHTPRRSMGDLLGNAVRFGVAGAVMAEAKASKPCCPFVRHAHHAHGGGALGCSSRRQHPPRTRPRDSALVDRQHLPPRHRPDRTATRRQRAGAAAQPEGTGRLKIRSVELERLSRRRGRRFIEHRNSMEFLRDQAAEQFERHTGSSWRPRAGSKVSHRYLTSAIIYSRDFLAARRRAENEVLLPPGPKIAFTGGLDKSRRQGEESRNPCREVWRRRLSAVVFPQSRRAAHP